MTYSVIFDDTDPVNRFPALLAFVPTALAPAWQAYFQEGGLGQVIKTEQITHEGQTADFLEWGMRRAQRVPEMPDMLRRAAVDAHRALHGLPELSRDGAWWRMTPEQAAYTPEGRVLLPFLTVGA